MTAPSPHHPATMTISELINVLRQFPQGALVYICGESHIKTIKGIVQDKLTDEEKIVCDVVVIDIQ